MGEMADNAFGNFLGNLLFVLARIFLILSRMGLSATGRHLP